MRHHVGQVPHSITPRDPGNAEDAELWAMVGRFATLVTDWDLADWELDDLLAVPAGVGVGLASGSSVPAIDPETRMRRALDVDALIRTVIGGADSCRIWLRRPNPGLSNSLPPLKVLCDRSGGLRAMRDAIREEASQARVGIVS